MSPVSRHTPERGAVESQFVMAPGRPLYIASFFVGLLHPWRASRTVERILIYKLDHLGDLLIATPALRAIRDRFPRAEIRIVIGEWNTPLLVGNPSVDQVLVYNSPRFTRPPYTAHDPGAVRNALAGWKPDLTIGLRDDWSTLLNSVFSSAARVERGRAHLYEWLQRRRTRSTLHHELTRLWETLKPLGVEPITAPRLDYYVTEEERATAHALLERHGVTSPFVLLHAGATQVLREWSLERFAELARHCANRWGLRVVLIGIGRERLRSSGVAERIRELGPVDLTGTLSLRETGAIMEQSSLYVGSDGGAMHLAAATGIPTVGLFGPGSYHVFSPVGPRTIGVSRLFPCSPCQQVDCIRPNDTCMQAITTAHVIGAVDTLLGEHEPSAPGLSLRRTPLPHAAAMQRDPGQA